MNHLVAFDRNGSLDRLAGLFGEDSRPFMSPAIIPPVIVLVS